MKIIELVILAAVLLPVPSNAIEKWVASGQTEPPRGYVASDANGEFCIECSANVYKLFNNSTCLGTLEGPFVTIGADTGYVFFAEKADFKTIFAVQLAWLAAMDSSEDYKINQVDIFNSYNEKVSVLRLDGMLIKKYHDGLLTSDQLWNLSLDNMLFIKDIKEAPNGELYLASGR